MRSLKVNHSCAQPTAVMTVGLRTEYSRSEASPNTLHGRMAEGAFTSARMDHGDATRVSAVSFTDPAAFWRKLYAEATTKKVLWVWAHGMGDALTLLRTWDELEAGRLRLTQPHKSNAGRHWRGYVLGADPPTAAAFRTAAGGMLRFLDSRNIGLPHPAGCHDAMALARGTLQQVVQVHRLVRGSELGVMHPTAGAMALAAFRHKFMTHVPACREAPGWSDYERSYLQPPCHRCYYIGATTENVYRLDITGAYTAAMQHPCYPLRHWRTHRGAGVFAAADTAERLPVLVRCLLANCPDPLPFEDRKGSHWRAGSGWVRLTGNEYTRQVRAGCVREVSHLSVYDRAPVLAAFASGMWDLRMRMRSAGNADMEYVVKLLANALHGALARKPGHWRTIPGQLPGKAWGEKVTLDGESGTVERRRGLASDHQRHSTVDTNWWSMPVISAFVLAYHREQMQAYVDMCPPRSVYYQDADSIHVNEAALAAINKVAPLSATIPGRLHVEAGPAPATYRGYQSYDHADRSLHSGVDTTTGPDDRGRYLQLAHMSLDGALSVGKPACPVITVRRVRAPRARARCRIGADGWTSPV